MPHFDTFDGTSIHYLDEGEGLPVLCLPGLTRTTGDFQYVAPYLSDVRLIRMDYRGRGKSGWNEDPEAYSVPNEAKDAIALLDHLGVEKAAMLGTSRGGLIGMFLAATAKDRMLGLALNDIGPAIERKGLQTIFDYIGRNPTAKTHEELAAALPRYNPGMEGVSEERWAEEARLHYVSDGDGLKITYDPALRDSFIAAFEGPPADLWPLFDATAGLPLALIWGMNSDLLSEDTVLEMQRRRPDMILARVPGRAHIPFLDEPESLAALRTWLEAMQ